MDEATSIDSYFLSTVSRILEKHNLNIDTDVDINIETRTIKLIADLSDQETEALAHDIENAVGGCCE